MRLYLLSVPSISDLDACDTFNEIPVYRKLERSCLHTTDRKSKFSIEPENLLTLLPSKQVYPLHTLLHGSIKEFSDQRPGTVEFQRNYLEKLELGSILIFEL